MTNKTGKNKDDLKRINRSLILRLVITNKTITRAELTAKTGLSKMAISSIVSGLINKNILLETDTPIQNTGIGRYAKGIKLSPKAPKIIGISIMREAVEVVLGDLQLNIISRLKVDFPAKLTGSILQKYIFTLVDKIINTNKEHQICAIGLTSIGPISREKGLILTPFFFYDLHDLPVVAWLEERYKIPVFFNHDNQSAVLADSIFGQAKNFNDILYVGIANGVGCGIMLGGELYDNKRGLPPEFGHISIDQNGDYCMCGNRGCIETYLRTPVILQKLFSLTGKLYQVEDLMNSDDKYIKLAFKDIVEKMACALVSLINIINSELIILGSDADYWPNYVLDDLAKKINEMRFVAWDKDILVIKSTFGKNSVIFGAMSNAIKAVFSGELLNDL